MPCNTKNTAVQTAKSQPLPSVEQLPQTITGPMLFAQLKDIFQQFKKSVLESA